MILTAIGIVIAIAVMLWVTGLVGSFVNYEKVEASLQGSQLEEKFFRIRTILKNNGGSSVQVVSVLVNNVPFNDIQGAALSWASETGESGTDTPVPLRTGVNVYVDLKFPYGAYCGGGVLVSGVTISLSFRSSSGIDYKMITQLP
ncbi:MAG: hypothetical protein RMI79_03120 [Nitrososphaerota archaeon]|nr:hypothetical protein [Nitrososphaerota archaeon]